MDDAWIESAPSITPLRLKNFFASAGVVALAWAGFHISPANRRMMTELYGSSTFSFTGADFVLTAAIGYVALLAIYYLVEPRPATSKSTRFWQIALEFIRSPKERVRQGLTREDRVAVLATLLKAFYAPLMAFALMTACSSAIVNGAAIAQTTLSLDGLADLVVRHGFTLVLEVIIIIDVVIFTIGYLVELPALKNEIRSVDPSLLGWAAALACYTPFNIITFSILGWQTTDYPQFQDPTVHMVANTVLLVLMALYTWASVALGFKASNLTHRGIVGSGPYRFVRHPAYVCKNIAWWIGCMPLAAANFDRSLFAGLTVVASMIGWTMLYILRAVTEEDHLRGVDSEYSTYAAKVRYRFIPGIA